MTDLEQRAHDLAVILCQRSIDSKRVSCEYCRCRLPPEPSIKERRLL